MRYILCLSYDGSAFCGWQIQPSSPSVQQTLEESLAKLCGGPVQVTGAGRTDTGVHAADYVCHFDLTGSLPFEASDFCYKLNAILPRGIAVRSVLPAADDFHARFSAKLRSYTYFIHRKKDPFVAAYSWQCGYPGLDFEAMNEACQYLLGTHDFSCFEKVGGANKTSICTITEAFWKPYTPTYVSVMSIDDAEGRSQEEGVISETCGHPRPHKREGPAACGGRGRSEAEAVSEIIPSSGGEPPYWYFRVSADRFLRNMVRAIVGTLIEVGRGKHKPEWVKDLVETGTRGDAGESVPGHALFLSKVKY
ncbi:MAG: tRNA pseudouridine synthase A [Bacteroidales bacterium]|nr:tRNA pseudouridine synthase A [Bacteroidales bacterium]MBR2228049.1 tRNA pseudouridine synthase A [Bacteroidales bacterium]MBR4688004.1 tRNA pseudouridine synthase A [Bacteroidales bacterium]